MSLLVQPCYFCSKWGYCSDCLIKLDAVCKAKFGKTKADKTKEGK